jgi:V/A-type H+-transporting ATPase subunit A
VGEENLPESQQLDLFIADLIREAFLIQNAFDDIDNFTSPNKTIALIKLILLLYHEAKDLLRQGYIIKDIKDLEVIDKIKRIKNTIPNDKFNNIEEVKRTLLDQIESLKKSYGVVRSY